MQDANSKAAGDDCRRKVSPPLRSRHGEYSLWIVQIALRLLGVGRAFSLVRPRAAAKVGRTNGSAGGAETWRQRRVWRSNRSQRPVLGGAEVSVQTATSRRCLIRGRTAIGGSTAWAEKRLAPHSRVSSERFGSTVPVPSCDGLTYFIAVRPIPISRFRTK